MNRIIITLICILVVIGAMITAVMFTTNRNQQEVPQTIVTEEIADENILDDCTDEYEQIEENDMLQANSEEEKVSPNCSFIEKVNYKNCGHTTSQYLELPTELVNLTEEQVAEKYHDWNIEKFNSSEVVLYKEVASECGEHYLIKDNEGQLTIYQILEDGTEKEIEVTGVTTEYLPETDKINMKDGIRVNGKKELNQLIEDFE